MAVFTFMPKIFILHFLFHSVSSAVYTISPFQSLSDDGTTLVSKGGSFELGFFSPGNSRNRYVGIWYKNIPVQTVVWVANRCKPINDSSGVLLVKKKGNLVLLYQNMSVVWSTNSSKRAWKPVAELLDSGNLVLRDEEARNPENYLWQSFDYPSDTLLPGMKLGWDLRTGHRRLSAWKRRDDPCPGDFTHGIEFSPQFHAFPEVYLWKGTYKFHRSGSWSGLHPSGLPELTPYPIYDFKFVYNEDEVYYTYNLKNKSVILRMVLVQTSMHESLVWSETHKRWLVYASVPRDMCDLYGVCGANGICTIVESPSCKCLDGFRPKSPNNWFLLDWSEGCVRNDAPTEKPKYKDGIVKFSNMKLPDTSHSRIAENWSPEECGAICLSNSSCRAYTNSNIRGQGNGCVIWYGDLIDVKQLSTGGQDLFIRVPHSGKDDHKGRAVIVVAVVGGVSVMLLLGYYICRRGPKGNNVYSFSVLTTHATRSITKRD